MKKRKTPRKLSLKLIGQGFFGVAVTIVLLWGSWFLQTLTADPVKNQAVVGTQDENAESIPDLDPTIKCLVHKNCGGGSKQIKQSECNNSTCCQIGDKWYFYTSSNKCSQDQQAQIATEEPQTVLGDNKNELTQPTTDNSYEPTKYFHCVLFDPWTGKTHVYDYLYKTEDDCIAEQRRMTKGVQDYLDSLPTPAPTNTPAPTIDYIAQCKAGVNSYYSQIEQNCLRRFGTGSSAGPACVEINKRDWNAALGACN